MAEKFSDDDFHIDKIYTVQFQQKDIYASFCPTHEPFQVYIAKEAFQDIYQHAMKGYKQGKGEIAGALIGNIYITTDHKVKFVEINASEPAQTNSSHAAVEIPKEEWYRIGKRVDQDPRYRLRSTIVGWYHSHPGFGIFMSGTDQNTQQSHFNLEWQVAIVIDPVNNQVGAFFGPNSKKCPLYKLPYLGVDKSVMPANDLLKGIISGKDIDGGGIYQSGNFIRQQLVDIINRLDNFQQYIQSELVPLAQESIGKDRAGSIRANNKEILSLIQGFENSFNSLTKQITHQINQSQSITSSELQETQNYLTQIKVNFDLVKDFQKRIEQQSTSLQDITTISLKQIQESVNEKLSVLSAELNSVKEKINDFQSTQKAQSENLLSKADNTSDKVSDLSKEVTSNALAEHIWNNLKRRLLLSASGIFLMAFLGGATGMVLFMNRLFSMETLPTPNVPITTEAPNSTSSDIEQTSLVTPTPSIVSSPTLTQSDDPQNTATDFQNEGKIITSQVNIRSGPGTDFDSLGVINLGEYVEVFAQTENEDWYQVGSGSDVMGWVAASFVDLIDKETSIPVVTITATPLNSPTP